tara:strand:+ start:254 stop:478 length:225 start_codon:yes stop_codon:yes gene_type:complete
MIYPMKTRGGNDVHEFMWTFDVNDFPSAVLLFTTWPVFEIYEDGAEGLIEDLQDLKTRFDNNHGELKIGVEKNS